MPLTNFNELLGCFHYCSPLHGEALGTVDIARSDGKTTHHGRSRRVALRTLLCLVVGFSASGLGGASATIAAAQDPPRANQSQWPVPPMPPPDRAPGAVTVTGTRAVGALPEADVALLPLSVPDASSYVVQLGDTLEIKHFYNPELNDLLPVRPDGRISLELIGDVQAAGLPISDLRAILLQRYAAYVRKPEVAVIVKEFGGNRVYVAGEVNQPGVLPTNGHLTILQAIIQAGGYKRSAEMRSVVVLRNQGTSSPVFLTIDLKDSLTRPGAQVNDTVLRPYDIVFVPQTRVARMADLVDQYVDELLPLPVTLGLSYLFR